MIRRIGGATSTISTWPNYVETYMTDVKMTKAMNRIPNLVLWMRKNEKKLTDISRALRWDDFGFEGRDGEKSTIWIGTEG